MYLCIVNRTKTKRGQSGVLKVQGLTRNVLIDGVSKGRAHQSLLKLKNPMNVF